MKITTSTINDKWHYSNTFPSLQVSQEFVKNQYDFTNVLIVAVPSNNFHGFLIWLRQVNMY